MSIFRVNVVAVNPQDLRRVTVPVEVFVNPGPRFTWLPADVLASAQISPRRKRAFLTATKQTVERQVGYAILRSETYETVDEVIFAEPGDFHPLGVRTIEGFGVWVDKIGHRFLAKPSLVAAESR